MNDVSAGTAAHQVGYYGKIPSKGDFVSRQLPRAFIDIWDQWLQECIVTSRRQLSDRWLDSYLISPIWRFALSNGICSESAWIGILMPSVDQVGRYFPLTLAFPVQSTQAILELIQSEDNWFNEAETIAQLALDQDGDVDLFNHKIDSLGVPSSLQKINQSSQSDENCRMHIHASFWRLGLSDNDLLSHGLNRLFHYTLSQSFHRYSFWWTRGSERVPPSFITADGLIPAHQYFSFLNGDWE